MMDLFVLVIILGKLQGLCVGVIPPSIEVNVFFQILRTDNKRMSIMMYSMTIL